MRFLVILWLVAIFSAPMLTREPLATEEVGRFVAAAEEIIASRPTTGPTVSDTVRHLMDPPDAEAILDRHGFTDRRWRAVALRVFAAQQAEMLMGSTEDGAARPRAKSAPVTPTAEMTAFQPVARDLRSDLDALAAETAHDREAIAPFQDRLDALLQPR